MFKRYNEIYRVQMPNITPPVMVDHSFYVFIKWGMDTYTNLGLKDAADKLKWMEKLENARKELNKVKGEKPVSQKMF